MAYAPIQLFATPQEDYADYWLKFYEQGTVTPLVMATDAGGGTTLAKAEISSGGTVPIGFIKTAGDALLNPFVNGDYDAWLFPTSAEADANDTTNALQLADNLNADPLSGIFNSDTVDSIAALRLVEGTSNQLIDVLSYYAPVFAFAMPYDQGGGAFAWDATSTETDNNGTIIKATGVANGRWIRVFTGPINVNWFGALGDGTTDDTVAIQDAIDSLGTSPGTVEFLKAIYLVTSTISVVQDRVHLRGVGIWSTQILFEPTADDICFSCTKGASVINQGSIKDMMFYSTDSTYEKTAIEIIDQSRYVLENISVGGGVNISGASMWSGGAGGSTGLSLKGREYGLFKNIQLTCDLPIVIGDNPNSTIDIDHYSFIDLYMIGNLTQPLITIEDGVNLTNVTFLGAQPWVRGSYGLYWNDTTSVGVSLNLSISNYRTEQGGVAAAHSIYISHNTGLHGLVVNNATPDSARDGMYLRNVDNVLLSNIETSGTEEVLNVDSTVRGIQIDNCFWQAGSTAVMTDQRQVWGIPKFPSTGALPPSAIYEVDTSLVERNMVLGGALGQESFTLANDGVYTLGEATMGGVLIVTDSEYGSAIYEIRGTGITTNEISDVAGIFSPTAGTAASTNIYWNATSSRYELENKRGAERTYRITFMGTYSSGF